MAVESSTSVMDSLMEKLSLDDPWVPPRSWDSLPSQSGVSSQPSCHSSPPLYATSSVSEPSLVRLAMNALQGVETALISIEKLSAVLHYSSADRTSHRIPNLWTRCSSNVVVGNLLTSIGQFGCVVFLLRRFVNYFTDPDFVGVIELGKNPKSDSCDEGKRSLHLTLINQAFAISVGKVIDGYISALNTLSASVSLRHFLKSNNGGCLTSIGHSEITLLEVYLHTMGLRTQIEALGNLCNVNHLTAGFPLSSLEDLSTKADSEFSAFPRSGALLSFLYAQLKVADPAHSALLKFLFLQSYEPYCDFIRSWIYGGSISDPYHEFVVECVSDLSIHASGLSLPTIRVRDGAAVPCFLEECLVPLCRTGQQLQVIMKLLELSNNVGTCDTHEEILPSLVSLSSEYPWFAFPLTFDKGTIEMMALVRASYYQQMLEKIGNILTKFDFTSQQVAQSVSLRLVNNLKKNLNHQSSSVADELIPPLTDRRNQNMSDTIVDSEVSSIMHEDPCVEDPLESSECSSSESSEEANEAEELNFASRFVVPSYLSALDFSLSLSTDNKMQNLYQSEFCSVEDLPFNINWKSDATYPSHKQTCLVSSEQKLSQTPGAQVSSSEHDLSLFDAHHTGRGKHDTWLHSPDCGLELRMDYGVFNTDSDVSENVSKVNTSNNDQLQLPLLTCASSKTFSSLFSKLKYDSTYFSMNPTLNRGSFFNLRTMLRERGHANYMDSYFDFTSVKDPLNTYAVKVAGDREPKLGTELSVITKTPAARVDTRNHLSLEDHNDVIVDNNAKSCNVSSPLQEKDSDGHLLFPITSGGSAWESLLGRSGNIANRSVRDHSTVLVSGADMPLDFVIKKCVLDEISLQYPSIYLWWPWSWEVNNVSIFNKLFLHFIQGYLTNTFLLFYYKAFGLMKWSLAQGFKLQEHLQSLRCYHFMELADWADLFIMSLWHRKWHVSEVDKRIPEIQGVLELAVQRSSCEGDPNKDRLYLYLKGDGIRHLSASAMGTFCISVDVFEAKGVWEAFHIYGPWRIHSFDFLGLGYRIDWPVSIILTPAAMEIYSEIFNFLIQVKLAVFSLSDACGAMAVTWLIQALVEHKQPNLDQFSALLMRQSSSFEDGYRLEQHKGEVRQISILNETRHKVNHFVSALQQYVQSQLSQVSWYRFLHSLKHKNGIFLGNIIQLIVAFGRKLHALPLFGAKHQVKDMLDLESVHMAYLTECFLSNETLSIAGNIQNILQCAMDFRSCLTGSMLGTGSDDEKLTHKLSQMDMAQVDIIRNAFAKNLEELYLIYLQSPKHGEFGLSRFWDYLNYNEYYSGVQDLESFAATAKLCSEVPGVVVFHVDKDVYKDNRRIISV
ncbi:hypothetical protein DH2020_000884 [Rehmannia glutinosa]|uniref:Gamma-tubulin complex component n=1 Tax=Rehmannia glutinosa TaxID=99300 RepID=A0ABR0XXS0_REHGL